ncbi:MAG: cytochrome P450 [Myxococcales bacterium]|nr:cytochrome P450 [Myxococcales bacterium]
MSVQSSPTELVYDPYDYQIDENPHPIWKRMRDEAPLYYNAQYDFYALSRFQDVLEASLDAQTYISGRGTVIELIDEPMQNPPMIFMDPPQHTAFRKLVSRRFTLAQIGRLEPRIRKLCGDYLDPFVGAGGFDYVADFGAKLPVMVISSLLGVPEEDQEQVRIWTDLSLYRAPGETGLSQAGAAAMGDIRDYWHGLIRERRARRRDDVMSELIDVELRERDGTPRKLTDDELFAFYLLISSAGNETVARFLGSVATILSQFPDQRENLVANPHKIPNAVEEVLRYEAPSPIQARWCTRDVELHGQTLPARSKVALLTASANRDEREFPDADRFDVDRKIDRHVGLGFGIHFCLGASLARLEGRVAIDETLRRFPRWDVDTAGLERVHTSTIRGYCNVPILY